MISVITTTHNTPSPVLARAWASLKTQTFTDWEWVIYDDSTTNDVYNQVYGFCSDERYVIRYFRPNTPSGGNIGYSKRMAFGLALGDYLLELDHDDELMPTCLEKVYNAFSRDKSVGFVYSDWSEILISGASGRYPKGWAFGYGSDYWDEVNNVWAMSSAEINRQTLSHIVSVPNHVRVWKSKVYFAVGGHNVDLSVADDYDLIIRTALATKMFHIPEMLYKQHIGAWTAQRTRNDLIQSLVPVIHDKYSFDLDRVFGSEMVYGPE